MSGWILTVCYVLASLTWRGHKALRDPVAEGQINYLMYYDPVTYSRLTHELQRWPWIWPNPQTKPLYHTIFIIESCLCLYKKHFYCHTVWCKMPCSRSCIGTKCAFSHEKIQSWHEGRTKHTKVAKGTNIEEFHKNGCANLCPVKHAATAIMFWRSTVKNHLQLGTHVLRSLQAETRALLLIDLNQPWKEYFYFHNNVQKEGARHFRAF